MTDKVSYECEKLMRCERGKMVGTESGMPDISACGAAAVARVRWARKAGWLYLCAKCLRAIKAEEERGAKP